MASIDLARASTTDAFLGGRFFAVQPADGRHRSGLEAVLLAAAVERSFAGTLVDLGAGAGVAGLAVAARCERANVILVERDQTAVDCAHAALALPVNRPLAGRVSVVVADVAGREADRTAAGLARAGADAVIMNPPFRFPGAGTVSPNPTRAAAHILVDGDLDPWLRAAASALKPRGRLFVVFDADAIDALLAACRGRFGAVDVLPVLPRATLPAHRIVLQAVKGARSATRILPPLVLHPPAGGAYAEEARAVLQLGASLSDVCPAWRGEGRGKDVNRPWPFRSTS